MGRLAAAVAVVAAITVVAPLQAAAESVDPGSRMMLVLDSSGSMAEATPSGGTRIDAAKDALRQVIGGLPEEQEVGLRVYGAEVFSQNDPGACTDSQLIVEPGTGNRDQLTSALDGYEPYGETPIGYALQEAGKDLGTEGPRTIVLVSDGEPTCEPDPCTVATELAGDGVDVRIDVVGLDVDQTARDKLRCIAENGHGTYYDAEDADDLVRSLDISTTRASRPFDLTGTPVQGTATPDDAPTITTGQYLDTVPLNDGLWYRIERTAPGSTIHVGVAHHSDDIGNSGSWAWVKLYVNPDELECASASSFPLGNLGYTAANTWSPDPEGECNTADVIYVHVYDSGPQPFTGEPVEVAVYEEPPLADPSGRDLVAAPEVPAWTPLDAEDPVTDVVPGTSISNSPVVSDGTYAFDINAGETQVVAIPLDWGQNVQAQLDGIVPDETSLGVGPTIQISGPVREAGSVDFYGSAPEDWSDLLWGTSAGGSPFRVGAQSLTLGYLNRTEISNDASIPGLRYVQVSYPHASDPMEYTLTLKTNGTAGEGAPEYADVDGLTPPAADSALVDGSGGGSADDEPSDEPGDEATEDQALTGDGSGNGSGDDAAGLPWMPIGLGAAGLLALGGAGWLARRNRATSDGSE